MRVSLAMKAGLVAALLILNSPAEDAAQDHGGIRQVLEQQRAAWNRGDLDSFMQSYWKSPDLTFFSGDKLIRGWQPTLERYRLRYRSGSAQMGQLSFTDDQIDMLASDAALVTARWHLTMRDGSQRSGLTTVICRQMKDGWKIIHDHSS